MLLLFHSCIIHDALGMHPIVSHEMQAIQMQRMTAFLSVQKGEFELLQHFSSLCNELSLLRNRLAPQTGLLAQLLSGMF